MLDGGSTQLLSDGLRVGHLVVDDATLDLGRIARTLGGEVALDDGRVLGSATLKVTGDEVTSSGTSEFGLAVVNTGTITVADGALTFDRALSGKGVVLVEADATLAFGAGAAVAKTQLIEFDGAATVVIAAPKQFAAAFGGFGEGATIELTGFDADTTRLRWKADRDGSGGTLKLSDEGARATLHFADGAYTQESFAAFQFAEGVLAITYDPAGGGAVHGHPPVFGTDTPAFAGTHHLAGAAMLDTVGLTALV